MPLHMTENMSKSCENAIPTLKAVLEAARHKYLMPFPERIVLNSHPTHSSKF